MKPNNANAVFDPSLQPVFAPPENTERLAITNSRDLFFALIHSSEHYPALSTAFHYLSLHLQQASEQRSAHIGHQYHPGDLEKLLADESGSHLSGAQDTSLNDFLLQFAPLFFTEPCWLASVSQTVSCRSSLAVDLTAMYLRLSRDGDGIANSRAAYSGFLQSSGIILPALHTFVFAQQPDVGDEIFDFAAIQLALAQFPRALFPELLGFTLAYCHSASLPERFFPNGENCKLPDFLAIRNQRRKLELPAIKSVIQAYLAELRSQSDLCWRRIQAGFYLYRLHTGYCQVRLDERLHTVLSPRQAMHKLLQSLISHAIGHHGNVRLGSKTVDEWFKETPFKIDNFLATLLHSPLVDRAKPENSKLLKLYDFRGPMFGVLDEKGKVIVKNWLLSELDPEHAALKKTRIAPLKSRSYTYGLKKIPSEPARIDGLFKAEIHSSAPSDRKEYGKLDNKELFYYLINNELFPGVLPAAKKRVESVLYWAKLFSRLPFRHYSHRTFTGYIETLYRKEVARYQPLNKKPKLAKEAYRWGIEQFAPTILTDGAWLQSSHWLAYHPTHAIGGLLEKIYLDEIGNGILEQNHPFIYQQLLDSVNIKLPPVHTREFVGHPGFIGGAFDIPVYLMAIAKSPSAFLPELLGLNMAIELSGLGNVYLRLSAALRYWGIDSAIIDVHTAIDNLASGHSALAMKAIQFYLDEIASCSGKAAVDLHWRRIYTGYCSLQAVSNRFKFSLLGHYFFKRPAANNNN